MPGISMKTWEQMTQIGERLRTFVVEPTNRSLPVPQLLSILRDQEAVTAVDVVLNLVFL